MSEIKDEVVDKAADLAKQLKAVAYTVRKIKDYLENIMGADIDGDGKVGNGAKKVVAFLAMLGLACACYAGPHNTNIAVWAGTEATPTSYVDQSGNIYAPYFSGNGSLLTSIAASGISIASNKVLIGNASGVGAAYPLSGDATINTTGAVTIGAGKITASKIDPTVVTNVLAAGMVLPAVDGSAVTNITGNNIVSNIPIAALTNAAGGGLCIVTNVDQNGTTNIMTYIGTIQRDQ